MKGIDWVLIGLAVLLIVAIVFFSMLVCFLTRRRRRRGRRIAHLEQNNNNNNDDEMDKVNKINGTSSSSSGDSQHRINRPDRIRFDDDDDDNPPQQQEQIDEQSDSFTVSTRSETIIELEQFSDRLTTMRQNYNELLERQFEALNRFVGGRKSVGESEENMKRNRFMDVIPYDENRVLLVDGDGNDYINATFINAYIAAQGPIGEGELNQGRREKTVDHFWSMIWQEKIECVVMLTQIVESLRPKCAQYWPEKVNDRLELSTGLQVILMAEIMEESFIRRQFQIEKDDQRRDVVQWHFREWLDSKAPEKSEHLLRFVSLIRQTQPSSPILVHCSAGVGRTGVYMALDILLQQIHDHDTIDVFNCVANLRRQRVRMVQTVEQYITIYNEIEIAIKEKLSSFDSKPELSSSVNIFHSKM